MHKHLFEQVRSDDRGASALIVAVMLVVLLGFGAIVVDAGAIYSHRRQIQSAADAAVLAGVQDLPGNPTAAIATAGEFSELNSSEASERDFEITKTYTTGDTIVAHLRDPAMGLFLAQFLGQDTTPVNARAAAVVSSPRAFRANVFPFGIMSKEPSATAPFGYEFGELVRLKEPSPQGEAGNFQFVDIIGEPEEVGGGANEIIPATYGGAPNPVYRGEYYYTQTGINGSSVTDNKNKNKTEQGLDNWVDACPVHASCTGGLDSFNKVVQKEPDGTVKILEPDCHRLIICPILVRVLEDGSYVYNWGHGNHKVYIIGFAYFWVDAMGTSGSDAWIDGRFVRPLGLDDDVLEWGAIDPFGGIAYRLID
jgi:Flp pilus assembly protein TadG